MLNVRRLLWDDRNVFHILRHGVVQDEVEEVCTGEHVTRQTYQERIILIGSTRAGRMLTIILEPEEREGVYYPVTARPASRRERRIYQLSRGE